MCTHTNEISLLFSSPNNTSALPPTHSLKIQTQQNREQRLPSALISNLSDPAASNPIYNKGQPKKVYTIYMTCNQSSMQTAQEPSVSPGPSKRLEITDKKEESISQGCSNKKPRAQGSSAPWPQGDSFSSVKWRYQSDVGGNAKGWEQLMSS